ncbi:MAG: DNA mismatch repair endonuclease MutL [Pseudomonadota bacterium]|nr:DNA mismatch repair endonuclease MutL [Pseudomonadota bacterium]
MALIRILPENLINQIAAGEVIERPASVVKELVENALDSGSKNIKVVLNDGGKSLIAVDDDGGGMKESDLKLAVERHATSKLPSSDLTNINFLGFRGEALPSIGAVSRLKIISRALNAESAFSVQVNAGSVELPVPVAYTYGTRVEVRDLFYVTPARLKFLKSIKTEINHVVDIVKRLAIFNSNVSFSLEVDGRVRFSLKSENKDLLENGLSRISSILDKDFVHNSLPLTAQRNGIKVSGFASIPTFNRGNSLAQFMFVNGRPVRDRLLVGAVRAAYQDYLASNRHPFIVLFIECPSDQVDVNVHPAKSEVRFRDSNMVRGMIISSLKHALVKGGHRSSTQISQNMINAAKPGYSQNYNNSDGINKQFEPYSSLNNLTNNQSSRYISSARESIDMEFPLSSKEVAQLSLQEQDYPLGVARAQVHKTYIIAQAKDGIIIVDQHAAHERLVYEHMKSMLAESGIKRQVLLIPEIINMDQNDLDKLIDRADEFMELGLVLESFGKGALIVREVPALLGEIDIKGLVMNLADEISYLDSALSLKDKLADVCGTMACHSSIRAGKTLNGHEMNALLREMENTPHSGQCNHGRPTYVSLKLSDIEKLFGRR